MTVCHDCNRDKPSVKIRMSDLFLCNECEHLREIDPPQPGSAPRYLQKKPPSSTVEREKVKVANKSGMNNADTDSQQIESNIICKANECQSNSNDFAQCSLCKEHYHTSCVNLKKVPARTTKWICSVCKDVPGQLNELRELVSTLMKNQKEMKAENDNLKQNVKDLESKVCELEQSKIEIEQLTLKVETLNSQLTMEVDNKKGDSQQELRESEPDTDTEPDEPSSTALLLGDSMLRDIKHDHFENTHVKSISGAKIADIVKELNSRDDISTFRNIVIHCGTNDVSCGTANTEFIESMEEAVTSIMISSPFTSVFISAICPRDNTDLTLKIDKLNKDLGELASRLGCHFIDSGKMMTFRNGDIDETQFTDGLHFNKRGNMNFIRALSDAIPELTRNKISAWTHVHNKSSGNRSTHRNSKSQNPHMHSHDRGNHQPKRNYHRHQNYQRVSHERGHNRPHHGLKQSRNHGMRHNRDSYEYTGCFNCGLNNHNQKTCRFNRRVRCHACNTLGHKERYCVNRA